MASRTILCGPSYVRRVDEKEGGLTLRSKSEKDLRHKGRPVYEQDHNGPDVKCCQWNASDMDDDDRDIMNNEHSDLSWMF